MAHSGGCSQFKTTLTPTLPEGEGARLQAQGVREQDQQAQGARGQDLEGQESWLLPFSLSLWERAGVRVNPVTISHV